MGLKYRTVAAIVPLLGLAVASTAHADGANDYYSPAPEASTKSTVTFSGSDWAKDSSYFYSGVLYALNRDLGQSGIVLRGFAGVPLFEYDADVEGGEVDGDGVQGDIMVGYMWQRDFFTFIGYIGAEYQDYDLTPDDRTSEVNGSEVGFKVAADFNSPYESPLYWAVHGAYSTAFNTYWARARVGYNSGSFVIGPEAITMGNDGFDAHRIGGFATVRVELSPALTSEITGYIGHQFVDEDDSSSDTRGAEGTYGGIGFTLVF